MASTFSPGSFYGSGAPRAFAGAIFTEVVHPSAYRTPDHSHVAPHFSLVLNGASTEYAGKVELECAPLTMVFRSAGITHRDDIPSCGARFFVIELGERWHDAIDAECGGPEHLAELRGGEPVWLALRLHREIQNAVPSTLDVDSLLFELCGHTATMRPPDEREPGWLRRVLERLDATFHDRVDLATVAAEVGVHPTHLARVFRRFRGRTVGDYVAGRRVQEACRRVLCDEPLDRIAQDVGFADQSHLTRVFKALTGTTPGNYRRVQARSSSTAAK
jgi:AraC family transcriptional regulator